VASIYDFIDRNGLDLVHFVKNQRKGGWRVKGAADSVGSCEGAQRPGVGVWDAALMVTFG
jgi:hypothetical protein